MGYLLTILGGFIVGVMLDTEAGWLWGGIIGYLLAHARHQSRRLAALEARLPSRREARAIAPDATPEARGEDAPADAWRTPPAPATGPGTAPGAVPEAAPESVPEPVPAASHGSWDQELLGLAREAEPMPEARAPETTPAAAAGDAAPGPRTPTLIDQGIAAVVRFFTTGNLMVRVGALVTLVGVAFLLKYMADRITVPVGMRLLTIAAGGVAMVFFGLWNRSRRPGFSLPFQGAGVGVLYLTCFAALRLYGLLPPAIAFALLALLALATMALATVQRAQVLAIIGVAGGFLAPVLASTGSGSHVELFGFYLVLNLVIAALAWFQSWRLLNWIGFVFTFGIASLWGAQYYERAYFASTEPFLVAHTALYIAIAILFAHRQPPRLRGLVDGTIVFGTPLVAFALQASMLAGEEGPLALSATVLGAAYVLLWAALRRHRPEHFELLATSFLALGIGFLTLAVPLAFDARVTSATWCLEGAALVWVGLRQASDSRRVAGMVLALLGSAAFFAADGGSAAMRPFLNAEFVGVALIAWVFLFMAALQRRDRLGWLAPSLLAYGFAWWSIGGLEEIETAYAGGTRVVALVIYFAASAALLAELARRLRWRAGQLGAAALAVVCALCVLGKLGRGGPPLDAAFWAGLAGAAAIVAVGRLLRHEAFAVAPPSVAHALGGLGLVVWLAVGMDATNTLAVPRSHHLDLLWVSLSIGAAFWLHRALSWPAWRWCVALGVLVPAAWLARSIEFGWAVHADLGALAWPLTLGVQWHLLRRGGPTLGERADAAHAIAFWNLLGFVAWGGWMAFDSGLSAWRQAVPALGPLVLLAACHAWNRWPVRNHPQAYLGVWLLPVAAVFGVWLLAIAVTRPGGSWPLPQLALLNPVDLAVIAVLAALGWWWRQGVGIAPRETHRIGSGVLAGLGFVSLNAMVLRAVHMHLDIAWRWSTLWDSIAAQAAVTTLWTVTALGTMILGARRNQRTLWIAGAWIMAAAVLKLFAVDTAGTGTLARVLAFFVVAAGLFLGGFLVPKPPARPPAGP